ncbi:MAG: helix-turn-helix domain-containing protein [Candidatus Nanopelagicales bacterium]
MARQESAAGRRERNKQAKQDRIIAAAGELFAEHGVDDVTTQQVADAADVAVGTLFLYARTKNELLLLVQNAHYVEALDEGRVAAASVADPVDAVMALLVPIIRCNRVHRGNGRVYLRELTFGDPSQPHHAAAAAIVASTGEAVAETLVRTTGVDPDDATVMAGLAIGALLLALAGAGDTTDDEVAASLRRAVTVLITPYPR